MIKKYVSTVVIVVLSLAMISATSTYEEVAPDSLADHLHMSHSKDPVDGGWLPNLTGLPGPEQVRQLTQRAVEVMKKDQDKACNSVDFNLKKMVLQHFLIYQEMANAQGKYLDERVAHKWAHMLAMILKESGGDTTNITDMKGHSLSPNKPGASLQQWQAIFDYAKQNKLNLQTNLGLAQLSSDRLLDAFRLSQDQNYETEYLEGLEGAATPGKVNLNTAIAIRRLIWFYQDFAQGRLTDSDNRIHQRDIDKPGNYNKLLAGLDLALMYCGTAHMFIEGLQNDFPKLKDAFSSIAYCKLGNAQGGYGKSEVDEICFAQWITLCPALNVDIAILTPLRYFQTRNQQPVCEKTFNQLLNKNPGVKTGANVPGS